MRDSRLTRLFGLSLLLGFFAFGIGTASAADPIMANPDCCTFLPTSYSQDQGETAMFSDPVTGAFHNVTSFDKGPDGKVLFSSATIGPGKTAPVNGTQYLTPGTYRFYCTVHGPSMSGTLVVGSSGKAVARPSAKVSVLSQSLKKVRNSKKLKVKLTGGKVAVKGVSVTVSKGTKKLGTLKKINLSAGASKTVSVKLSSSGLKSFKKAKKVKFSAKATVPFGKTASANRQLH